MIIKFSHFVRILKEIILKEHEFVLSDSFSLPSINFPPSGKSVGPASMSCSYCGTHFYYKQPPLLFNFSNAFYHFYFFNQKFVACFMVFVVDLSSQKRRTNLFPSF